MSGIVRRIDELGRIVIPKEIRKTLHIKEGELLEIQSIDDKIVLNKYSELKDLKERAANVLSVLSKYYKYDYLLSDRDSFILGTSFYKNEYVNKQISPMLESLIETYQNSLKIENDEIILADESLIGNFLVLPIREDGNVLGLLIIDFKEDKITDEKHEIMRIIADLLTKNVAD